MPFSIAVHDQNPSAGMVLLHHVGKMMPVVPSQRRPEDNQIESFLAHGFFHALAAYRGFYLVTRLLDGNRLCSQYFRIALAIEDLELE